jgi:hypothetical protein
MKVDGNPHLHLVSKLHLVVDFGTFFQGGVVGVSLVFKVRERGLDRFAGIVVTFYVFNTASILCRRRVENFRFQVG